MAPTVLSQLTQSMRTWSTTIPRSDLSEQVPGERILPPTVDRMGMTVCDREGNFMFRLSKSFMSWLLTFCGVSREDMEACET